MEEQSKKDKSYSGSNDTKSTVSINTSENSELNLRASANDSCQAPLVYVNSEYEKPLEPTVRMTIPNPKRTLLPLDKPSYCDICGKKFARTSHYQQHRKTHFSQNASPIPVNDKSYSQNINNALTTSAHYSNNSIPSYLDIHKMAVEQVQAATAAESTNSDLEQKFDASKDPYLLSLGSVAMPSSLSSSQPPVPPLTRENLINPQYSSVMTHNRDQFFASEAIVNPNYSSLSSSNFKGLSNTGGGVPEKPFSCDLCPKSFARRDTLVCHKRGHAGSKPFRCDDCGKAFSRRDKLHCHSRIHSGEKPYVCTVCGRAFSQSDKLKCHMRTHTGERPHPCDLCEKRFARRDTLHCHRRTHTGEKPFPCLICEKRFARRDKLTCHRRTHSGEKPYKCGTCGKQFARSDKLRRHGHIHNTDRALASGNGLSVNIHNQTETPSDLSLAPPHSTSNPANTIATGVSLPDMDISSKIHFPQQGLPPVFPPVKEYSTLLWQTIY